MSSESATKADLDKLRQANHADISELRAEITGLRHDMESLKQDIFRHFDAAVEKIEDDLKGANADEISSLKDVDNRLHERIVPLEQRAGIETPADVPHPLPPV